MGGDGLYRLARGTSFLIGLIGRIVKVFSYSLTSTRTITKILQTVLMGL
jgi:hypothetical protein